MLRLRIASVRTGLVSEKWPTPTALDAAKRTVYDVYGFRLVMTKASVEQKTQSIHRRGARKARSRGDAPDALPETRTLISFHCFSPSCFHCRTKPLMGVPPLTGMVLREKETEAGPGVTDR